MTESKSSGSEGPKGITKPIPVNGGRNPRPMTPVHPAKPPKDNGK